MIKKLFEKFWSMRHQFIKYAVTGISAVVLDMGSLYILKEYGGINPVVAVVVNQFFIVNYVFFINKYWSFGAHGMTGRQMFRFLIVASWNYAFAIFWMWLFYERLEMNYLLARILNIMFAVSWNFLLYKFFVYRIETAPVPVNNPPEPVVEEVVE
jgi:putative flippase GtrA